MAYTDERVKRAIVSLRALGEEIAIPSRRLGGMVEDIERRHYFFGIESIWPLFYESAEPVASLLLATASRTVLVGDHTLFESMDDQAERSYAAYDAAVVSGEPALAVEAFFESPERVSKNIADLDQVQLVSSPMMTQISTT